MNVTARTVAACAVLLVTSAPASAQGTMCRDTGRIRTDDLLTLDLDALLTMTVITASKSSETLSNAPGVMSVVSRDELRRFGGVTLREVLSRVPGLMPTTSYFTGRDYRCVRASTPPMPIGTPLHAPTAALCTSLN